MDARCDRSAGVCLGDSAFGCWYADPHHRTDGTAIGLYNMKFVILELIESRYPHFQLAPRS
jgi:hypothetical protein